MATIIMETSQNDLPTMISDRFTIYVKIREAVRVSGLRGLINFDPNIFKFLYGEIDKNNRFFSGAISHQINLIGGRQVEILYPPQLVGQSDENLVFHEFSGDGVLAILVFEVISNFASDVTELVSATDFRYTDHNTNSIPIGYVRSLEITSDPTLAFRDPYSNIADGRWEDEDYWPTEMDVEDVLSAPDDDPDGIWRDVGIFYEYLTATSVDDISPNLRGADILLMQVQIYDDVNDSWDVVTNWSVADNVTQTFAPRVRIVSDAGVERPTGPHTTGSNVIIQPDDRLQVLVPIATQHSGSDDVSPAGDEPPDNALRIFIEIAST